MIYHYLSLSIIIYNYLSLSITIYHSLSFIYHYLSLSFTICHYLSLSIIIYHYLSLTIYICLYLSIFIYIYIYLYLSIYIYLSICLYTHTYTLNLFLYSVAMLLSFHGHAPHKGGRRHQGGSPTYIFIHNFITHVHVNVMCFHSLFSSNIRVSNWHGFVHHFNDVRFGCWRRFKKLLAMKQNQSMSNLDLTSTSSTPIWLVVSTPLKNMKVSWEYYSQYMGT